MQGLLRISINLLLVLYLVYLRYLFNMGPTYMFSQGVETLRNDGYLTLILLTHGNLAAFHRLLKYGKPPNGGESPPETGYLLLQKCGRAEDSTLLVEYLSMQNRYLTGEERNPKTGVEMREVNGGIPLLTDLCLARRSDPLGMIRGIGEVLTCFYGPTVTYAFPDTLVTAYRHSVVHVTLISIPDGTALNWCKQESLRAWMSETMLFGKVKDPELIELNFRELESTKIWNLKTVAKNTREVLRIPA